MQKQLTQSQVVELLKVVESYVHNDGTVELKDMAVKVMEVTDTVCARGDVNAAVRALTEALTTVVVDVGLPDSQLTTVATDTLPVWMMLYQWGVAGFPHFSLAPDFCAALNYTDFGDGTDEPLVHPFHSYTLSFPPQESMGGASKAFVCRVPSLKRIDGEYHLQWRGIRVVLMNEDPCFTQFLATATRKELLGTMYDIDMPDGTARKLEGVESAWLHTLRVFVLNALTYIEGAGPLPVEVAARGAAPSAIMKVHKTRPLYDVGRPIKLNPGLRKMLTLQKDGGGEAMWTLDKRFVVRGHWRNQAYGEKRALRKRLWVEPYYKGPETKEALERVFHVGTENTK